MSGIGRNGGRLYAQERDWTRRPAEPVQDRLQAPLCAPPAVVVDLRLR